MTTFGCSWTLKLLWLIVQSDCAKYHKNGAQGRTCMKLCTIVVQKSKMDLNLRPKKLATVCVFYRPEQVSRLKWNFFSPKCVILHSVGKHFSCWFRKIHHNPYLKIKPIKVLRGGCQKNDVIADVTKNSTTTQTNSFLWNLIEDLMGTKYH